MTETRVVIVEDEPPARAKLKRLIAGHSGYRIVAEADDVAGGVKACREACPDVLFLDIQLGAENGFDLLSRIASPPLVVFTTAYHDYALRAFDVAALDYLLKPFDRERFARAIDRVAARLALRTDIDGRVSDDDRLRQLAPEVTGSSRLRRLLVHDRGSARVVAVADVVRLSAAGNYVEIHTADRRYLLRATLARLARRLDPVDFLRVHRSHLVRADFIAQVAPWAHGDLRLTLKDGSDLLLSRRYRSLLPKAWLEAAPIATDG